MGVRIPFIFNFKHAFVNFTHEFWHMVDIVNSGAINFWNFTNNLFMALLFILAKLLLKSKWNRDCRQLFSRVDLYLLSWTYSWTFPLSWIPNVSRHPTNWSNTTSKIGRWYIATSWWSHRVCVFWSLTDSGEWSSSSWNWRSRSFTDIWGFVVSHFILGWPNRWLSVSIGIIGIEILSLLGWGSNNRCVLKLLLLRVHTV